MKDSAVENFNVGVGIARGVILPRDLAANEALSDDEITRQAIQWMVLVLSLFLLPSFEAVVICLNFFLFLTCRDFKKYMK